MPSDFFPHVGGVEEMTLRLAQTLQSRGVRVLVVTNRWPVDLPAREIVEGVEVARVRFTMPARRPGSHRRHLQNRRAADRALADLPQPDLVHVHCGSSQLSFARRYAQKRKLPLIFTTHGESIVDAQNIYGKNPYLRRQYRKISVEAALLTACSTWTKDQASRLAPRFADAEVVLNGINPTAWEGVTSVIDEPVFGAYGRHVPQKGYDLLLQAFALVLQQLPTARLLLGGDGPDRRALEQLAGPQVEFLGSLDRRGVADLLSACRVIVVSSRVESFGIVAVEALAAGRGLVYADNGGLREAADDCGRICANEDVTALAAAMVAEFHQPTEVARGRARAARLSWDSVTDQYCRVYDQARSSVA